MHKLRLILLFLMASLTGCSTHLINLEYKGAPVAAPKAPVIAQVHVSDSRGTENNWLGAIRGGFGNKLKTLRTAEPTNAAVKRIYERALSEHGLLGSTGQSPYTLNVSITKFDCSYYFNREAHAHLNVSVKNTLSQQVVFYKTYRSDDVESGVGAGIFGSVETLAALAEKSLNNAINQMLIDPAFTSLTTRAP